MMRHCSICGKNVNEEEAPILAMGGFGNPKYLCDECAEDIDLITSDNDPEVIEASMSKLTGKLSSSSVEDRLVVETVTAIFSEAGERAKKIKEGTYDFSKDEAQEEIDDIPEQLLETEEDRALDEEEEKQRKKLDGIMNWISLAAVVIAVGLAVFFMLR